MNRKNIIIVVCIIIIGAFWLYKNNLIGVGGKQTNNETITYKDADYGFQISYAKTLTPEKTFRQYYALSNTWRVEPGANSVGTPLVAIPVFRVDNNTGVATGKPYPLYFDTEVRIGASKNPDDVANCLKPDPNYTTQPVSDVTINGIVFKKFSFQDAAMMQYVQGESYRTVRGGTCFAVEQLKTGSNYRDPSMTEGVSDEQLNAYYNQAGDIIQTFRFI